VGDFRFALRSFRKAPAFAITVILALALGIGANTAVFSVIDAVLLKPVTFPEPGRIVFFYSVSSSGPVYGASAAKFNLWRLQTGIFQDVAAYEYSGSNLNLTGGAFPEQVHAIRVSAGYFRILGAPVLQGRTFTPEEDRPGGARVAVLSYGLWQRRFASDPRLAGKTISLGGAPYTVIGILGPSFNTELDAPPDLWLPFQIDPAGADHAHYFTVIGRLKPGVTVSAANARLALAAAGFQRKFPAIMAAHDTFRVQPFLEALVGDVRPSLLILAGAVSLVLLAACANVANLLLVRAAGRKREIALRAALGAGRGRIVRQLLTETILLSFAGGALGLILGSTGVRALLAVNTANIPRLGIDGSAVAMDWRILTFTVLVSLATGIVFGLVPALDVSKGDLATALKEGGDRSGAGVQQNKLRSVLVVAEISLALILLIGAGLLIRTFHALHSVDPGFDSHNILTMRMSLAGSRFDKTAPLDRLVRDAAQRIEAIPGVARAGAAWALPLEGFMGIPYNVVSRANTGYDGRGWLGVSPGYFEIFRIPLRRGRLFTAGDDAGALPVVVVNQAMARRFWSGGDPVGELMILGKGYGPEFDEPPRQIVGIVGDVQGFGLQNAPQPVAYVPLAQVTDGITALAGRAVGLAFAVRTRVEPHSLISAVRAELRQASGGLPVAGPGIRTMDEIRTRSTARQDFNMLLLTVFGCCALLLASIGIYGMMSWSVEQRTREIAIRLALGAGSRDVRNMIVRHGMRLAAVGVALGTIAALGLTRLLAAFLFGVHPLDPLVFTAVPVFLAAVALFAAWLPALRATRIDPADALRQD
jgi:predicted permease